jgi:hypothetical protein
LLEFLLTEVLIGLKREASFTEVSHLVFNDDQAIREQFKAHFKNEKQLFTAIEYIATVLKAYKIFEIKADPLSPN